MGSTRHQSRQWLWTPVDTGINASAINAEVTSNTFDLEGVEQIDIYVDYTYGAGTAVTVELDTCWSTVNQDSTPTWYKTQSTAIAAGVGTQSDFKFSKTVSAANQNYTCSFTELNAMRGQLRIVATGSPTTSDVASVRIVFKQH